MKMFARAYQDKKDIWTFVASSDAVDRYGDILEPSGWDLKAFKKNPIALWQHNGGQPIGTWEEIRVEENKLLARLVMVKAGISSIADMVRGMIEQRILRAVSVGFLPKAYEKIVDAAGNWTGGYRFTKSELMEISVVSVPANSEALAVAKSMGMTRQQIETIFAKTGEGDRLDTLPRLTGPNAQRHINTGKTTKMKTLAERIADKEAEIATLRDALTELTGIENPTDEQVVETEERTRELEQSQKALGTLQSAQRALLASARPAGSDSDPQTGSPAAPAQIRSRGTKDPGTLIVRTAMAIMRAHVDKRSLDDVLRVNFGGQKDIETLVRAAVAPADTSTSGWAAELVNDAVGGFVEILRPGSIFWNVAAVDYTFTAGKGGIKLPGRSSGTLNGGFVGEAAPIPVKKVTFGSTTIEPCKLGVITPFTRELMRQSDPALEPLLRQMMIEDTQETIDTLFLDATAASAGVRPAGLQSLAGSNTAASAGTSLANIITDLKAALTAMGTNKMGRRLMWILDPQRIASLSLMTNAAGNFMFRDEIVQGTLLGYPFLSSVNVPDNVVFLVDAAELARAAESMPQFDISEQATIHMEDTTPLAIGTAGSPNTVAAPVRSLFQTATMALRLLWDLSWNQRRSNAVYTITSVSW